MSHVPALRHVKNPTESSWSTALLANSLVIVPAFSGRGLAHLYDAWHLWRWMRELVEGKNTVGRTAAVLKKPYKATFNLFNLYVCMYVYVCVCICMYVCTYVRFFLPNNPHKVCLSKAPGPSSSCWWTLTLQRPFQQTTVLTSSLTWCTRSALHWHHTHIVLDRGERVQGNIR